MRDEVTNLGAKELRTPEDVTATIPNGKGSMLIVINSTCGCAAGSARPGLSLALRHSVVPKSIVTVFAGQDKEATARVRECFPNQPPSSPSFAMMYDGQFRELIHRHEIEGRSPEEISQRLILSFEKHCAKPVATDPK